MNKNELIKLYKTNPCRYSATALWKTLSNDGIIIDSTEDVNGIKTIKIYNDTTLFLDWESDNSNPENFERFELCVFHVKQLDYLENIKEGADGYFRLKYSGDRLYINDTNYVIKSVDIENEAKQVSEFISKCYRDLHPNDEKVLSWTKHSVFKNDLWIWIADPITGEYLGLGIAEYDKKIKEGSLEWIQVLPKHREKGIGSIIVDELTSRMDYADFITVSGKVDNASAEKLYRNCGFEGDDMWYVVKK